MTANASPISRPALKRTIRTLHRWLGLISGILLLIVALTGSMLAFEEEGRDYLMHDYYHIQNPGAARLPLDQLVDTFKSKYPKTKINSIRFKETPDAAVVFFTKDRYIFINPYTSAITADISIYKDFFTTVRLLHTQLLLGKPGNTIIDFNVLFFFIILISGLILWWPKKWRQIKQAISIKTSGSKKRFNYDLHRALGFYALPILFIIAVTGLFMAFDTTKSLVATITRSKTPENEEALTLEKPKGAKPIPQSLQQAYKSASTHYPGATETFVNPGTGKTPIRIVMRYPYNITRQQNTLYFNQYDNSLIKADCYTNYSAYDKVARSNYNLHTGKIGALGIASKILWCLAALAAASLPITGLLIYLNRPSAKSNRSSGKYPARNALTTDRGVSTLTTPEGPGIAAPYPSGDHR